jgi:D-glycero-alpha-D-manno-heptose-7-phosphate kinase
MLIGTTPVRISFAGGGTDLPEFYENYEGHVISSTIDQFTYSVIQSRNDNSFQAFSPDFQKHYKPTAFNKISIEDGTEISASVIKFLKYKKGLNVMLFSDVAAGSGLGASSSLAVNLVNIINYLKKEKWGKQKTAETAYHIGRKILHWPIGKQDEYIASFGGFNFISFKKNKITVQPIKLKKSSKKELQENLLLFFLGDTRNSSKILTNQIKNIKNKKSETLDSLSYVKNLTLDMNNSLKKSDLSNFGNLLDKGWVAKKRFSSGITNEKIDKIYEKALKMGALGGKLTGAGGGGHMLFYCEKNKQKSLINSMKKVGLNQIHFNFYEYGPKVIDPRNHI